MDTRQHGRRLRDLLLTIARPGDHDEAIGNLVRSVDPDELIAAAAGHRMVTMVQQRLLRIDGVPRAMHEALRGEVFRVQTRRLHLLRALTLATRALDVPALTVKGPVLAEDWYVEPAIREFRDVDLLVQPEVFGRAVDALSAAGIEPAGTNWHGFLEHEVGEAPMRLQTSVIDLHWHVVALGQDRRRLRMSTAELFERAVPTRIGELDLLTLCPVDTLLHLCVNTGLGGARRLRGLIDIDTVVRTGRVDPDEFVVRANSTGTGRLCSAILQRSRTLLGTPVEPDLLRELSPSPMWLAANRLAERLSLWRRTSTSVASGLLLGSGRRTAPATAAAFGRASIRAVATRLGRPDWAESGGELDWQRLPADGDVDGHRRAFLDWVASVGPGL